jgi:hypothetical protein
MFPISQLTNSEYSILAMSLARVDYHRNSHLVQGVVKAKIGRTPGFVTAVFKAVVSLISHVKSDCHTRAVVRDAGRVGRTGGGGRRGGWD